jgi:hypothetical protein
LEVKAENAIDYYRERSRGCELQEAIAVAKAERDAQLRHSRRPPTRLLPLSVGETESR